MSTAQPECIIAYTSEDGRYDNVRDTAVEMARSSRAALILYDIDAAPRFIGEQPLPTEWSGEGDEKQWPHRLSPDDLERAGRHGVADQVRQARAAGVQAFAWLPGKRDSASLADYARQEKATLVLLPGRHEDPSFGERLRGETEDKLEEGSRVPIAFVEDDGSLNYARRPANGRGDGALSRD